MGEQGNLTIGAPLPKRTIQDIGQSPGIAIVSAVLMQVLSYQT
ncbi:conserved hypothetical protein [Xenorhabdus nematophila F1]|uniref:Uncharacterized protein n=1 Tax=Xenorhabdus nematophila (strain ATCC 19061 / DSM 3370 / CCUG 14189 / LMG 1036 / NCIMB 9965 / AN6) TaxID=406817 RepID=D3VGG0_XENNA|nr:hypothetical protein XNC1_2337 [Xenorhabdus nematophila ATCC 19061]CCW32402.1 conserved hypothetical protein [Xenorhabdus nematophila F1]